MGFVCPRCQNEFTRKASLREHIGNVHDKKRHKCDQCEKDFSAPSTLRYHKLTKHEGKKIKYNKRQCPHCNKPFRTGGHFNQHVLTHRSVKPFLCPFCSSYAAKRLGTLKQHIDSVHFKCRWFCLMDGCNKNTARVSDMSRHLKKRHNISSNFANQMEKRRTAATPSSLTPVRGKLPTASTTNNNDPREASTSVRQQSAQVFTVKFQDVDTVSKLRSLLNRLELIATSASSSSSSSSYNSRDDSSDQNDDDNGDKSDENQETKESESEDSALFLVEEEMAKRRRLTWFNPDATGSSSDDDDNDDDDNDNNDEKSNSKSSSSSSSSSSSPKREEPKELEEDASSSSSGPPPRRIDVKPRNTMWIPTGEISRRGIDVNQLQREPSDALEPYKNWFREQQEQEREKEKEDKEKE